MKRTSIVLLVLTTLYVLGILYLFPKWIVDDAYILFRYADNWITHSALTWNVGQDAIEGYTGIAMPIIIGSLMKLGVDPVLSSHVIGVSCFLLGAVLIFLTLRRAAVSDLIGCVAVLLYVTAPIVYTHTFGGLETMFFSTTIVACLYMLLRCLEQTGRQGLKECLLLLLLLLVSLVRPEGVVLAGTTLVAMAYIKIKRKQDRLGFVARATLLYVIPGLLYFLWRWDYYGQLLPNTFYAKSFHGLLCKKSVLQLIEFMASYMAVPMVGVIILNVLDPDGVLKDLKKKSARMPPLFLAYGIVFAFMVLVLLQYSRSTLVMNYSSRFFTPMIPVLMIGIAILLNLGYPVLTKTRQKKPLRFKIVRILLVVLVLGQIAINIRQLRKEISFARDYKSLMTDVHIKVGKYVGKNVPASEWLISYLDAGAIPYFSRLRTVDFGKLNDEYLSRGVSEKKSLEYFFSINAGVAVFTSYDWGEPKHRHPLVARIMADPRFSNYVFAKKFNTPVRDDYFEFVFLRKDLAQKLK